MTFTGESPPPLLKDVKAQAPKAICVMQPTNTQGNLLINRDRPPFDDARVRKAMVLAIDRKAFSDIISQGINRSAARCCRRPRACWGMPPEFLATVPGYGADVEKAASEGRKIMRELGYGPDKPLKIKVSTRNIADYRDRR